MKELVIFTGRDGKPSMRKVYSQMHGSELHIVRTPPRKERYIRRYVANKGEIKDYIKTPFATNYNDKVVIRWGNRIPITTNNGTITYNKVEALKLATDKKGSRHLFIEKGVRCPRFVTPENITAAQYPVIARPLTHSKARNFVVLRDINAFRTHYNAHNTTWYYSEFIDKQEEYRVHCAHGKVLDIMKKPAIAKESGIAWNRSVNHEAFDRVKQDDYIHDVCLQALLATQALGLDFSGVDVMLKDGLAYVLEANTSPTLNSSEHVSARYAKYFNWLARGTERRTHIDFTQYKKPQSFAWKNEQLAG